MYAPSKKTRRHGRARALAIERLNDLSAVDLTRLTDFAQSRLGRLHGGRMAAEDALHSALHSIVRGTQKGKSGRRPKLEAVRTKDAFLNYIRSATNSVIEAAQRRREVLFIHESIHQAWNAAETETTILLAANQGPDADPVLVDFKVEMFSRLRQKAPRRLQRAIDEWEQSFFWTNGLPPGGPSRDRNKLQQLSGRVFKEIARDLAS
jgi:hypothetical protein